MTEYEERAVPVHPSQSRRAMHNYAAAGIPILGNGMGGGAYVIVIAVPVGAPTPDWQTAPPRSVSPFRPIVAFDWRVFTQIVCILAIVGGLGYFAWSFMSGADLSGPTIPDARSLSQSVRDWWSDVSAPWEPQPEGEPVVERTGFRWPWESAVVNAPKNAGSSEWSWPPKNPVGDAIDTAGAVIMWLVWALVAVGVLWLASIAVGAARRFRG